MGRGFSHQAIVPKTGVVIMHALVNRDKISAQKFIAMEFPLEIYSAALLFDLWSNFTLWLRRANKIMISSAL